MVIVNRLWLAGIAASLTLATTTSAQQRPNAPGGRGGAAAAPEPAEAGVPAVERVSTTHHTANINGKAIAYTANTGTMADSGR